jgi:hypothetical protein
MCDDRLGFPLPYRLVTGPRQRGGGLGLHDGGHRAWHLHRFLTALDT